VHGEGEELRQSSNTSLSRTPPAQRGWSIALLLLGVTLVVFGIRLFRLSLGASPIPHSDDWRLPQFVLLPWEQSKLTWKIMFQPHNEHRIFFVRLTSLAIYLLNSLQWDILCGMVINILATLGTFLLPLSFGWVKTQPLLILLAGLIWSAPVAVEDNLFFYFGMPWYQLLFFSSLAIRLHSDPLSARWCFSILAATCAFYTNAGIGALCLIFAYEALLFLISRRNRPQRAGAIYILALLIYFLWFITESGGSAWKARGISYFSLEFVSAFSHEVANGVSWPLRKYGAVGATIVYAPFFLFVLTLPILNRRPAAAAQIGALAAAFCIVHTSLICFGRGYANALRYFEIPLFGVFGNAIISMCLMLSLPRRSIVTRFSVMALSHRISRIVSRRGYGSSGKASQILL
jgi:hypothetical protein